MQALPAPILRSPAAVLTCQHLNSQARQPPASNCIPNQSLQAACLPTLGNPLAQAGVLKASHILALPLLLLALFTHCWVAA